MTIQEILEKKEFELGMIRRILRDKDMLTLIKNNHSVYDNVERFSMENTVNDSGETVLVCRIKNYNQLENIYMFGNNAHVIRDNNYNEIQRFILVSLFLEQIVQGGEQLIDQTIDEINDKFSHFYIGDGDNIVDNNEPIE